MHSRLKLILRPLTFRTTRPYKQVDARDHVTGTCRLVFGVLGVFLFGQSLAAQPQESDEELILPVIEPETPEFQEATEALRAHVKKLRATIVRYNTSETPAENTKWKETWYQLLAEGHDLHLAMVHAAVEEYKTDPGSKRAIADMLHSILKHNIEDDRMDGMVEVAQVLIDNGYNDEELPRFLAMAAYATGQFDKARPYLEHLVEDETFGPQLASMLKDYEQAQKDWEQELEYRQQDAEGEPLPRVLLKTTKGDIELELFENQAPETVGNFIHLIERGFYDHLTFHRVLEHFMVQGGCPNGDGTGDADYSIYGEAGKPNARKFFRGSLSMALGPTPDTGSSQFFITLAPAPQLNEKFTVFGRVIDGMEVLSNINRIDPENKEKNAPPVIPDEIRGFEILYKRDHEYQPNKVSKE